MKKLFLFLFCSITASLFAFEYDVVSGDYELRVSETVIHSVRSIKYKGYAIGAYTGYYGSVLTTAPGKYIGAGHKEGGVETLVSVTLTVDGKTETPTAKAIYKGEKIVIEKRSRYAKLLMLTRLTLTPQGLTEQKRFIAEADQPINSFYAQMYCWDKKTTDFFALTAAGKEISGKFTHEKVKWHVNSEVKYVSVYNADKKTGVVIWYPTVIPGDIRKATFWEVPKGYNKFYMMTKVPKLCKSGYESQEFTCLIGCYNANDAAAAPAALAAEIKVLEKLPIAPLPVPKP